MAVPKPKTDTPPVDASPYLSNSTGMMIFDSVRGLNMTMVRNEPIMRDLAKSNRELISSNRELIAEMRKSRRQSRKSG